MGNRGLETRNSKRQIVGRKPEQSVSVAGTPTSPVVGALEVQNVKKAINRYGTLPKGARIGAYLESLRTPEHLQQQLNNPGTIQEHSPTSQQASLPTNPQVMLSPRAVLKAQPQMIRSNSSGGVTMTNNANASLNKLQRHRTTTDSSLITFSSFRSTGSPKRIVQPTLADLEFPPPPIDLPPPPEEFENPIEPVRDHGLPPHPHVQITPNNDVSNTEPSVEEASTRFGVSLRKREPSTDSCSSLGSPADGVESQPATSVKEKLEMKLVAEIKDKQNRVDPATRLLSELEQTMAAKHEAPSYKSSDIVMGRKILPPKPEPNVQPNFKAQLKKVGDAKRNIGPKQEQKEESNNIIDFKSRLRKVENQGNTTDSTQGTSDSSGEILSGEDLLPPPPPPPTSNRSATTNGNGEVSGGVQLRRGGEFNNKQKTEIKIDVQGTTQASDPSSDEGKATL